MSERTGEEKTSRHGRSGDRGSTGRPRSAGSSEDRFQHLLRLIGNQAALHALRSARLQPKLTVSRPDDSYEQEADRVADTVVRMPEPPAFSRQRAAVTPLVRRQPMEDEELQRQPGEEEEVLQGKAGTTEPSEVRADVEGAIRGLSGGSRLPEQVRSFMEPRFGADFGGVRVHSDTGAHELARSVNARAFTVGRDIVFGAGEYRPGTPSGDRLLAHELAHTVQQSGPGFLQRKILIAGKAMTVDTTYLQTVKSTFGDSAVTIVEKMHNKGNAPEYAFDSWDKFRTELRIRTSAIKGMDAVHAGCCNYPSTEPQGYLNPTYWKRNGFMDFTVQTPFPSGKEPSDAVEAIFASGAGTQLECLTMTIAIEYYSLLKGMGKNDFNKKFKGGSGLLISTRSTARGGDVVDNEYDNISATRDKLLPGDWVYFKNFGDYPAKHPGGLWRGENAIVMGDGKYRGFGVANQSEDQLNEELVKHYNTGLPTAQQKTKTDLLAEGGGLQTSPVFRPNVKKLTK